MTKNRFQKGFTLIELLVVIVIVGILAAIVSVALNDARRKGSEAGVKSNLSNARAQAEIFFNTNSVNPNTYINVCSNSAIGTPPVYGLGPSVLAAAKASRLNTYDIVVNGAGIGGNLTKANCNENPTSWAAEVPLLSGGVWCIDSTSQSFKTNNSIGFGTQCIP